MPWRAPRRFQPATIDDRLHSSPRGLGQQTAGSLSEHRLGQTLLFDRVDVDVAGEGGVGRFGGLCRPLTSRRSSRSARSRSVTRSVSRRPNNPDGYRHTGSRQRALHYRQRPGRRWSMLVTGWKEFESRGISGVGARTRRSTVPRPLLRSGSGRQYLGGFHSHWLAPLHGIDDRQGD